MSKLSIFLSRAQAIIEGSPWQDSQREGKWLIGGDAAHPVRVRKQGMPAISTLMKLLKYSLDRSASVWGWRTSIAFGPCRASRDLSLWTVISAFPPSLYIGIQ